jgi:zinc protease
MRYAIITKDAAAMREMLVSGAPSPINYPTPKPPEILEQDKEFIARPFGLTPEEVVGVKASEMFEK